MKDSESIHGGTLELRHHNNFIESMRDNIKELNRSMSSIEKMIAQSRRIVLQSKQNIMSRTVSKQHKNDSPVRSLNSHSPHKLITVKQATSPTNFFISQSHSRSAYNDGLHNISKFGFGSSSKTRRLNTEETSLRHQQNLAKFKPKAVKKQIELRRSGAKIPSESKHNEEIKSTPKRDIKGFRQDSPSTEPFQRVVMQGNEIYKFSPMKTASKDKNSHRLSSFQQQSAPKIKLKATPRNNLQSEPLDSVQPKKAKKARLQMGNIRIEDDEEQEVEEQPSSIFSYREQPSQNYRYKTDYSQQQDQPLLIKITESPQDKPDEWKTLSSSKKINIRLFSGNDSHRKQPSIASYRDKKVTHPEFARQKPKENRAILVKQLEQLETASTSEQQRKAKFILKIKKYGFVEKHLTEFEINAIYDHLVWTGVPELKWPIYIVDEVYKKMKSTK